ncbi:MAG: 23S rRNA (uracil(1939)-C(5))-methyltransferase RlmD [Thermoflexibacter sp.]|jgi:23S rRNA (uracil1939-C5)-methyltransferase|nr:23S rRNA (uracil(1939)-C(5))-methyltransferase RlmD [Thermoflexibacter sp.]
MTRKRKEIILEKVKITDFAAEGKSVAKLDGQVIFIQKAVPEDVADLRVMKKKSNFMEAKVERFHEYSSLRATPFCQHFGDCGGCQWQNLQYEHQIRFKQQQVIDNLKRIGKVELPDIQPILGSKQIKYYRNKLNFTFSSKRWLTEAEIRTEEFITEEVGLGFYAPQRFDKVLDLKECHLQAEPSNSIRLALRKFAVDNQLTFFDLMLHKGLLRSLIIRITSIKEIMVIVQFYDNNTSQIQMIMEFLKNQFPEITSLYYVVNQKANDTYQDQEMVLYMGKPYIIEEMEDLKFQISPKSFFQTNSYQAVELYKKVREFADLKGDEVVYDLYTGTGSIACFVAKYAKQVIGIEYVPEAIEDAIINAQINQINNTTFYAGDIADLLNEDFLMQHPRPDVIITDPPRAGMHQDVVEMLLRIAAPKIVYVSCNPATQARDLALMNEKYKVTVVQPVDMFPHTQHVENIVVLELR